MVKSYTGRIGNFKYDDTLFKIETKGGIREIPYDYLVYIGPKDQDVMIPEGVEECFYTFERQKEFNAKVTFPNTVRLMTSTFAGCSNFNQEVKIPDSVTIMRMTFSRCRNLNSKVTLGKNVRITRNLFSGCTSFNQPVELPEGILSLDGLFNGCRSFNQDIKFSDSVRDISGVYRGCVSLDIPKRVVPEGCLYLSEVLHYTPKKIPIEIQDNTKKRILGKLIFGNPGFDENGRRKKCKKKPQ